MPDRLSAGLLDGATPRKLAADEVLFVAGDPGNGFYRVEEGLLKISIVSASGAERILAILGPGSIVGDLAIIDGKPRSASVTRVARLPACNSSAARHSTPSPGKNPEIYKYLAKVLADAPARHRCRSWRREAFCR